MKKNFLILKISDIQLDEAVRRLAQSSLEISSLNDKLQSVQESENATKLELFMCREMLSNDKSRIEELLSEQALLKGENAKLSASLRDIEQKHLQYITDEVQSTKQMYNEKDKLERQLSGLKKDIAGRTDEIESEKKKIDDLQTEIQQEKSLMVLLKQQNEMEEIQMKELRNSTTRLKEHIEHEKQNLAEFQEQAANEKKALNDELEKIKLEKMSLEHQMDNMKEDYDRQISEEKNRADLMAMKGRKRLARLQMLSQQMISDTPEPDESNDTLVQMDRHVCTQDMDRQVCTQNIN